MTNQQTTTAQKPSGHVYLVSDPTPIPYIEFHSRLWVQLLTPCCGALAREYNDGFQNLSYCTTCAMRLGFDYGVHWRGLNDLLNNGYVTEQPEPRKPREPRAAAPIIDDEEELL